MGKRGPKGKFYVFYDEKDFVECFGTAEQLVADGRFKYKRTCVEKACRIRHGKEKGNVVVLG